MAAFRPTGTLPTATLPAATGYTGPIFSTVAVAAGHSTALAISYAFYSDAERACLHQALTTVSVTFEDRIFRVPYEDRAPEIDAAVVPPENKIAIVAFEDRLYRVPSEARTAGNQPRKRVC